MAPSMENDLIDTNHCPEGPCVHIDEFVVLGTTECEVNSLSTTQEERGMMTIGDIEKYQQHRANRGPGAQSAVVELWLPVLLFGSVGAMTWAIRGSDGWDGIDGSMVPGLALALLWYYLCHRKGIDARGMVLWLGMGIALGGELGYGQYVSWIRGRFNVGDGVIHIAPWIGYAWFAICGIAKGDHEPAPPPALQTCRYSAMRRYFSPGTWG